jgi:hypothetical protein
MNTIVNCYIGTNGAGTGALGNTKSGIVIESGASNNTIGGTAAGSRNVISGNGNTYDSAGDFGVFIKDSGTTGNKLQGNYIGLTADGTATIGNGNDGVYVALGANGNTIGGPQAAAGNVISGNGRERDPQHLDISGDGVEVWSNDNLIQYDVIGLKPNGMADPSFANKGKAHEDNGLRNQWANLQEQQ